MTSRPVQLSEQDIARSAASRLRLLKLLREAAASPDGQGGLGVGDLAGRTGLHANTVRAHLKRLVAEGSVLRHSQSRSAPGRPRLVFTAAPRPDPQSDNRNYRMLAEMLTGMVSDGVPDPAQASVAAGEAWGSYLAESPPPHRRTDEAQAVQALLDTLTEVGFSPALSEQDDTGRKVLLHHCPFLEVADAHRDIVCSLHLGLMRGALAEMRAPVTAGRLDPLVAPSLCITHLVDVPTKIENS